jgi:3-dehydroquinate synthase
MSKLETVHVALGARAYDVLVGEGLLANAGEHLKPVLKRPRVAIVTDETVARLHLAKFTESLARAGIAQQSIILPPGEQTKCFAELERLLDRLIAAQVERNDVVVALGGGVIGDLAGFAAAILRRGVEYVQIPTTLLSQVDSSVGGKTAIDTAAGKNLVGAFHQPRLVLADIDALDTLPQRELLAGYAEVVKYGLLGDADFFAWLEANGERLIGGDKAARRHAVAASVTHKARIVEGDERETGGKRALLNLGHTFGHALEVEAGLGDQLLHGEGVAIGMVLAFDLSVRLGLCPAGDAARARRHLARAGLPVTPRLGNAWPDPERLIAHMAQDKKVSGGKLTFILARGIGQAFVTQEVTTAQLHELFAAARAA